MSGPLSGPLLRRTVAANRVRLAACALGLAAWGVVLPVMYASFGRDMARLFETNPMLEQFSRFGGGDLFSLAGAIALGFIHPFTLVLMGVIAIGYPAVAIAGERQRGTLEVTLARPISRHRLYLTLLVAGLLFLGVLQAVLLASNALGALVMGVGGELALDRLALLWLAGWLLFGAYLAIAFAASVSFDRLPPALGVPLVFLLLNYLVDVVGSLWPAARWLRDWSMFQLVKAQPLLQGEVAVSDLAILVAISAGAIGYAWVVFPRRDLAAPS